VLNDRSPADPVPSGGWWDTRFRAMGTSVRIMGHGGPVGAGEVARVLVDRLEQSWSRFRADSELSALNASEEWSVPVSPVLAQAVHRAGLAWRLTDGWFDPTVLDALVAAGYDRTFRDLPGGSRPATAGADVPGAGGVRVDLERGAVRRPPGVHLDLGGLGKGLAADLVAQRLLDLGVDTVSVSMGGDVRVAGVPPDGGWRIPVEDPFDDRSLMVTAVLDAGAIVTSSTRVRRWPVDDGGWAHHLIDPTTGRPSSSGLAAVVVVAAEAWWAEVLAKAALVAGPDRGAELLERHGAQGWLVHDDTEAVAV
jgi:thiamine biosynthesis lipoprotein